MSKSGIQRAWKQAVMAAGVHRPDGRVYSIHCARHTVGTLLYQRTGDLRAVQHLLGHRRLETTTIYAQPDPATVRQHVEELYDDRAPDPDPDPE